MKINRLLGLILILMESYIRVMCYCDEHDACLNKIGLPVALCIRHQFQEQESCTFQGTSQYYEKTGACTPSGCDATIKNYCKSNPCQNNSTCVQKSGSYNCNCRGSFHGRNCEKEGNSGDKFVQGVSLLFCPFTQPSLATALILIKETGDDMKIMFSAGISGEVNFITKMKSISAGKLLCTTFIDKACSKRDYGQREALKKACDDGKTKYIELYYDVLYDPEQPGVIDEPFPEASSPNPGFKVNRLSLTVYNKGSEEFSEQFDQVITYRKNICPKQVIILNNCGESSEKPFKLEPKREVVIESTLKPTPQTEEDCPYGETTFTWAIYSFGKNLLNQNSKPLHSTRGEETVYEIKPFSLQSGKYKVKLTAEISGRNRRNDDRYEETYSGVCFIEVLRVPLVAKLKGGDLRTVSQSERLVVDGSESYDPNWPQNKQPEMDFKWVCKIEGIKDCSDNGMIIDETEPFVFIISRGLKEGLVLLIDLTVIGKNNEKSKTSQTITVSKFTQVIMEINCRKNCGSNDFKTNPKEVVYLEVNVISNITVKEFTWVYVNSKNGEEKSTDIISQSGIESHILVIKANVLTPGLTYTFTVKPKGREGSSSKDIIVNKGPNQGDCKITPPTGYRAKTKFDIICTDFTVDGIAQLNYEFYQKTGGEEGVGTIVGYSVLGELKNVILTEEVITVRVSDIYGMYVNISRMIELKDADLARDDIEAMLGEVSSLARTGDSTESARTAGALMDVMKNISNKQELVNRVLTGLSENHAYSFTEAMLFTSALKKVVTKGTPQLENGIIDSSGVKTIGALMATLSSRVLQDISQANTRDSVIQVNDVTEIASTLLKCADVIVKSKDDKVFDGSVGNLATFAMHNQYKRGTAGMIRALGYTGIGILSNLLPHEQETVVQTNDTLLWLKVESPRILANLSGIPNNSSTKLKMSKNLGKRLEEKSTTVSVAVTTFKNNPYWWDIQDRDVASEIISVSVWDGSPSDMKPVTDVPEPIDIYLNVKNAVYTIISGNVTQPSPSDTADQKDCSVAVHTLEAPVENSNGKLFIEFQNLKNNQLLVLVLENLRPDYDMIMKEGRIVTSTSPLVGLSYENVDANSFHFIGILPGVNMRAGSTVSYNFKMYSIQCKIRQITVWTSPACTIGDETSTDVVHCRCSHFSFFGSSLFVAPNTVHPIKDLYLLMTIKDNPLVFAIIVTMLTIYLILLFWTIVQDRRDGLKRKVITLEDNFPGEKFAYLVIVYTAFNIGAATDANVGIRLFGSEAESRAHILRSSERKVMRRNADDWFLLLSPWYLGVVESIHIWHDHTGQHPDWSCKKVQVYDMATQEEYTFVVERWLSAWPGEFTEALVRQAQPNDLYEWKKVVAHNIVYNLQENHLWASIFMCHPRALITKTQRLTMTFCIIMVTLLSGIMFYGVAKGQAAEDQAAYELKIREAVIAVQCTVISAAVTSLVITCFRKSHKMTPIETTRGSDPNYAITQATIRQRKSADHREKRSVLAKLFFRTIHSVVKGKPLMPVLIGVESPESVVLRQKWAIVGWVLSQTVIWGSGFFIILYGLKLGKVISELWVTTSLICFVNGVFVSTPLKILIVSAVLAMFGEMYNLETYECDIKTAMRAECFGDEQVLADLIQVRSLPMYHPLPQRKVRELQSALIYRNKFLQAAEFVFTIIFFLALLNITGDIYRRKYFYINSHIITSLTKSWRTMSVGLSEVIDRALLTEYLLTTFIPRLFKGRWYNRQPLTTANEAFPETGWFFDTTHRLVGVPQLRQIRVKPNKCFFRKLFNVTGAVCLPGLKKKTEDTGDYGFEWKPVTKDINKPLLAPWTYRIAPADSPTMYGESGIAYHGGGYNAELSATQQQCASTISDLSDSNWWDPQLRGFIAEVSVYNANTDSHTFATIVAEQLASGAFTHRAQSFTIQLSFHPTSLLLFAAALFMLNVQLVYTLNREGLIYVLTWFWSSYDLLLVLSSDASLIIECVKVDKSISAVHIFQQSGNSDFFYFSGIVYYQRLSLFMWFFVLFLSPIRIVKYKPFVSSCKAACWTLYSSRSLLTAVGITIIVAVVFQLYVVNHTICPMCKQPDVDTKFYSSGISSSYYSSYNFNNSTIISLLFAITCSVFTLIIKIILIKMYKIISEY